MVSNKQMMSPLQRSAGSGSFRFTKQGMWVAVVYDSPTGNGSVFYVGQVYGQKSINCCHYIHKRLWPEKELVPVSIVT